MPVTPVSAASHAPVLRQVISRLKAALVVSAAAILSQAQGDLDANAAAAFDHFDDVAQRLHAVRDELPPSTVSPLSEGDGKDADRHLFHLLVGVVDNRLADVKRTLHEVVRSPERQGLDAFVASVGQLGRAVDDVMALLAVAPPDDAAPFHYDQFFLESMQELAQRDWSAT